MDLSQVFVIFVMKNIKLINDLKIKKNRKQEL